MASSAKAKASPKAKAVSAKKPTAPVVKKAAPKPPASKTAPKPAAKVATKVAPAPKPASKAAVKPTAKIEAKKLTPVAPIAAIAPIAASRKSPVSPPVSTQIQPAVSKTNTAAASSALPKAVVLSLNAHKKYAGLTEAEIVKQPESEYMSKAQLAFFKEKLTELRSTILHNATDTGEHLRDVEVATDPSDRATQEEEYTLELRTRDRERKLLKKVDKVLRMIDDGSFGWCEETGEPIGIARLIARPTATLSIEAQERRERMQKLFGD